MKKHLISWLVMFLAISLFLPIYSMADMTLTLEDSTGNRIYTPGIKSFAVGADNNLIILFDQPFNFTDLVPDILLGSCTNCSITGLASVTATQGAELSFNVQSSYTSAVISLVAASYEIGLERGFAPFLWPTGNTLPGSYLAVFQALDTTVTPNLVSQLPVMIKITPPETVTPPTAISPLAVTTNQAINNFTASGATVSTAGHTIEYQFNWGDNSANSNWSSSPQSHTYTTAGTFIIQARARCATDYVESTWYSASITISDIPTYTVTVSVNDSAGGSVSPSSWTGQSGGTATFTVTINTGYNASVSEGTLSSGTWTIFNVTSSHTATITFTQIITPPAGELLSLNTFVDVYIPAGTEKVYIIRNTANNMRSLTVKGMGTSPETFATYTLTLSDGREFPTLLGSGYRNEIISTSSMISLSLRSQLASAGGNIAGNYLPIGDYVYRIKAKNTSNIRVWANLYQ